MKPSIFKKSEEQIKEFSRNDLPAPKPSITKKEPENTKKVEKKEPISEIKKETKQKITTTLFVLPKKKPITYKVSSNETETSKVLNKKDFDKAKEVIQFIKDKKWNSALKLTEN